MKLRKLQNFLAYYQSVNFFNLLISFLLAIISGVEVAFYFFIGIGLLLSIGIFEIRNKQEYLFYSNNGWSKIGLIARSFCFNLVIGILIMIVIRFFENA